MLGDVEHPISFLFEPRYEGAHVKVVVRAGLRGMRALAGELTLRPEEWVALREALGRSVHDETLAATLRESIHVDVRDNPTLDRHSRVVLATLDARVHLVHLDVDPVELDEPMAP